MFAGCSTPATASVENYCGTVEKHRDRYLLAMSVSDAGSIEGLISAVSAIGDLQVMWNELAEVAPAEIKADTVAVRDAWEKQMEAAVSGDFQAILGNALLASGPMGRVDGYIKDNCEFADALVPIEPEAPDSTNPGGGWEVLGDLLVKGHGYEVVLPDSVISALDAFTPDAGAVTVDAVELLPAEEVTAQKWTVAGEPGESYLVGAVEVREPASGLDPETWVTRLIAVDVRTSPVKILADVEVASAQCEGRVASIAGSQVDAVAVDSQDGCDFYESVSVLQGWDAVGGRQLWSRPGSGRGGIGSIVATTGVPGSPGCFAYTGVDTATGQDLWQMDGAEVAVEGRSCEELGWSWGDSGFAFSIASRYAPELVGAYYAVDGGHEVHVRGPLNWFDPVTEYAVSYGANSATGIRSAISVYDTATGETVYEIDQDRVNALNARPLALIAGRLFVTTTDQYLEIEVDTGDVVRESATGIGYAIAVIGDYAYFTDGTLQPLDQINEYRPALVED